jgi:hypothetical protein
MTHVDKDRKIDFSTYNVHVEIQTTMSMQNIESLEQLSRYVVLSSVPYQHILKNDATVIEKLGLISQKDLDVLMSDDELRDDVLKNDELKNERSNNNQSISASYLPYLLNVPKKGMYYGAKHGYPCCISSQKQFLKKIGKIMKI